MKRRTFVLSALGAGAALLVGWGAMPPRSRHGTRETLPVVDGEVGLNGWIKIAADGAVLLAMHRSEMGQGVHTALATLVAEELNLPLARVRLIEAGMDKIYGNVAMFVGSLPLHPTATEPGHESRGAKFGTWMVSKLARELGVNATGGSSTIADSWDVLRWAAATARAQLLGAASLQWKLSVDEITIVDGIVQHASGPKAHFGELARAAAGLPPGTVTLKDRKDWTLIGKPLARTDALAKSQGRAGFGLDVRQPGQLYAALRMCPMLGGSPRAIRNENDVLSRPGVLRLERLRATHGSTAGVAVIARTTWHARQAVQALDVEWQAPPHDPAAGLLDSAAVLRQIEARALDAHRSGGGFAFYSAGDAMDAEAQAAKNGSGMTVIDATYRAPYLAHATMEPMNCTAQWKDGRLALWAPTQVPGLARAAAARALSIPEDAVTVHVTLLGGGFGRRLEADFVAQAALLAQHVGGAPVQLVWSREEDMTHDFYRPAGVAAVRAVLDAQGKPVSLRITGAGDAITPRWMQRVLPALAGPIDMPDKTAGEGLFDLPYAVPNQRIAHVATRSGVPIGFWRAVGHSHHAFFSEGLIDEMAAAAKQDPVAFRMSMLGGMPRHAAVLRLAADKAGWGQPLAAGRARGVALHESFGSIVAQVLEVSVQGQQPRVHRVVCAIDCGTVVNPGIVAQQMESGVIFGLTAALFGKIDIVAGQVQQTNFPTYPLLSLAQSPAIETHIMPSTNPPAGVGEPGTPPVAPALAAALFALTGKRLRELPLAL
jgi:isoquinoline 1-oxidoreductase subunit beta